jgi:ATP-dependent Clp protease ATP-binding subunit ClpC
LKNVIDLELAKVRGRLRERGHELELTDAAKEFLINKGSNLDYGARPLRRALENFVEDPLSEELLKGEFQGKDKILVDVIKDEEDKIKRLSFTGITSAGAPEPVGAAGRAVASK